MIESWEPGFTPCHCPVCGGFLVWDKFNPKCNKCRTELMIFPEVDEESGEELDFGKICPISHSLSRSMNGDKKHE